MRPPLLMLFFNHNRCAVPSITPYYVLKTALSCLYFWRDIFEHSVNIKEFKKCVVSCLVGFKTSDFCLKTLYKTINTALQLN